MLIKYADFKNPRLMFGQKKMTSNECNAIKRVLSGLEYVCGSSFTEFLGDKRNPDTAIFERVFVKENLTFPNIELP